MKYAPFILRLLGLAFVGLVVGLSGCANRLSLDGGPADETPPLLLIDRSTPSGQTNFQERSMYFFFDEFITQSVSSEEVIVSPPLTYPLRLTARGKRLEVRFDEREVLKENTTYLIQFGSAIKDLNEENEANNLKFLFSTGSSIDSLEVHAQVYNYADQSPVPDVWVLAYTSPSDTVLRKSRPSFLARTDSSGRAVLSNMPTTMVQLYALMDENRNYRFDSESEQVGFLKTMVNSSYDPDTIHYIYMYTDQPALQVFDAVQMDARTIYLTGNEVIQHSTFTVQDTLSGDLDTLDFYFMNKDTTIMRTKQAGDFHMLFARSPGDKVDTLFISTTKDSIQPALGQPRLIGLRSILSSDTLYLRTQWSAPIDEVDPSRMLYLDTTQRTYIPLSNAEYNLTTRMDRAILDMTWPTDGAVDSILILPGALRSAFGQVDSTAIVPKTTLPEQLSNLFLKLEGLLSFQTYQVSISASDGEVMYERQIEGVKDTTLFIPRLLPVTYTVDVVTDRNRNGHWDAGRFDERRLPEPRQQEEIKGLRANWDVEKTVNVLKQE